MQEAFGEHTPIIHPVGCAIPKESIWLMLSSGETGKLAEASIISNLKQLCRMHKIPFNKSKNVMLDAIQRHEKASHVFVRSYMSWYELNRTALSSNSSEPLPEQVAVSVGSVEHKCGCAHR
tara:strand:+ start:147 stop:509 length:363 start_codon:yes stop_codon:yes gene_type:complete